MNILQEALIALLSGLTTKTGEEIHWKNKDGISITIEPIDIEQCKYIVRHYYANGQKSYEIEYQDKRFNGYYKTWYKNGQIYSKAGYKNGLRHGKYTQWHKNNQKELEVGYRDGWFHGKFIQWTRDGQKYLEHTYNDGILIK